MAKSPKKEGPTAQEKELSRVSQAQWADYVERFRPAEAALIRKAEFTAGEKASAKGQVAGDVAAAFKGATRETVAAGGIAGADVSSGKVKMNLAKDAALHGKAKGIGQVQAVTGGELDSQGQQLKIAAMGRGIAHEATANMARGAQRATSLALAAAQAKSDRNNMMVDLGMSIAGAATKKYQSWKDGQIEEIDLDSLPKKKPTKGSLNYEAQQTELGLLNDYGPFG